VTRDQLSSPTNDAIARLRSEAARARVSHQQFPKEARAVAASSSLEYWQSKARTFLFRSKRAATLADLLEILRGVER
jgi:hypothetical protein